VRPARDVVLDMVQGFIDSAERVQQLLESAEG
jgi:hypothetical protein